MSYCSRCGVEVHDAAESCPLCQAPIQKFPEDPAPGRTFPTDELTSVKLPRMNRKERIRLASVLTAFAMMTPVLITMAVDLTLNTALTWSVYPIIILTSCLLIALTSIYLARKPESLIWTIFLIICSLLFLLNKFTNFPLIALKLGVPISLFAVSCSQFAVSASMRAKKKGANVAAFILIASGLFCIMTDLLLSYTLNGRLTPGWSLIVLAATQPVSMILLYLHYRKGKDSKLKKYFHI